MKKKVLIITYYWPPAGGPGVQRWLKFVKYLPQFNIEPVVYCPQNPNYPIIDEGLLTEVPKDITVIKHPIREPYKFAQFLSKKSTTKISSGVIPKQKKQSFLERLLLFVRGNFFIPDARKNWVKPSVSLLSDYIINNKIDTLITTGPPHSLHLIGLNLKAKHAIRWIADFRDPWTTIGYHKALKLTKVSKTKHLSLEHKVLNTADAILVTSNYTKQEFLNKTEQPIFVITNGYDTHNVSESEKDIKFTLAHIGSLLSDRNPIILWESLSELIQENSAFAKAFQLNLIGVVSDTVLETIYSYGLKSVVNLVGYVPHKIAIKYQLKSQVLLLIEINSEDTKAIIPGKIFEYIISKTPILGIGPDASDIENIIKNTNTGYYFNYKEKHALKQQIIEYFNLYLEDVLVSKPLNYEVYSRKNLTSELAKIIKS